jgi:hypothetical protein
MPPPPHPPTPAQIEAALEDYNAKLAALHGLAKKVLFLKQKRVRDLTGIAALNTQIHDTRAIVRIARAALAALIHWHP